MGAWNLDRTIFEMYEIKPITYGPGKSNNSNGIKQLHQYVTDMSAGYGINAVEGTTFNPDGVLLDNPVDSNTNIKLYTYYSTDPGMIYYGIVKKKKPEPQPAGSIVPFLDPGFVMPEPGGDTLVPETFIPTDPIIVY